MSIEQTVWSFLTGQGLPASSTAAMMGNIYQESAFSQSAVEGGSGAGFGLCQWSYGRRTQLEAYGTDLTHQLNFLWTELTGKNSSITGANYQWSNKSGYSTNAQFMSGAGSVATLTAAVCFCWERPNPSMANLNVRQQEANQYYNQFSGSSSPSSTDNTGSLDIISTNFKVVAGSQKTGDILFGRRCRITLSDNTGNAFDVSALRCTFSIIQTMVMEPNMSQIVIDNLSADTENAIEMNSTRVTVEAGYEGTQFGLIFDGDILQTIRDKTDSTTYELIIIALDSDRSVNFNIANFSVLRGQTARTLVDHIANSAKYPVALGSISRGLETTGTLTRGKVFFGKSSDYLRQIAQSNNSQYYTENGKINIINMVDLPDGTIFDLNIASGLIGTPQQTDYGISGKCLLNPTMKINTLIHIDNSLVRAEQLNLGTSNSVPATGSSSLSSSGGTVRNKIISEAQTLCDDNNVGYSEALRNQTVNGKTYYDCSSFVVKCYAAAGVQIDDITGPQWLQVQPDRGGQIVALANALPGDLVFYFNSSGCYHIAIYAGNNNLYAASTDNKPWPEQVAEEPIYGTYKIGRIKALIAADAGQAPSASTDASTNTSSSPIFRSLDKDGIYRIVKMTYTGDTRGSDWFCQFETVSQAGGIIPAVTN